MENEKKPARETTNDSDKKLAFKEGNMDNTAKVNEVEDKKAIKNINPAEDRSKKHQPGS